MATDFYDAHLRHLTDANMLYSAKCWANADHLYGVSAECGLKALMMCFGMSLSANGVPNKPDREHINKLSPRYETYRSTHLLGVNYALPQTNPFANWDVNQRYEHQASFTQHIVDPHKQGAECVKALLKKAQLDGLI